MRKLCTYGVLVFLLAAAQTLNAQTVQGVVTGSVFDSSGAILPGATVTLTNEGTNITQTTVSGPAGEYRFPLVPPGTYSLDVKSKNFREWLTKEIVVGPSQTVSLNATLELGSTTQTVEVTTTPPLVQTGTSDLTHSVNSIEILSSPMASRNVYDLAFAAPQVSLGMDFGPASGGERESGTAYLLNGSDNNNNFSEGSYNVTPPVESVQEVNLITNNMSAQYGRGGGVVVSAVQKPGTNAFHGAVYEFNRNRSLNAGGFFDNRTNLPKPVYLRNQYGGEIDGPIKKDKTFFSFAYDQIFLHTGYNSASTAFTPSELTKLQAGAGPLAKSILASYPQITSNTVCPDEPAAAIGHVGCVNLFDPQNYPRKTYYGRIDQNFSDKDRASLTLNIYRQENIDKFGGGYNLTNNIPSSEPQHFSNVTLVETHTFGPTFINEVTVAHNRHFDNYQANGGKNAGPSAILDESEWGGFGPNIGVVEGTLTQLFTQDRWQLADNATLTRGRHSVKFGAGWQHGILYRNWDLGSPGYYEFGSMYGPTPQAAGVLNPDGTIGSSANPVNINDSNFQNDFPYFQELSIDPRTGAKGNAYRHYSMDDFFAFVQDDFKLTPHLTLNLGLRWDRYGAPTEQHGIVAQFTNFNCIGSVKTTADYIKCVGSARTGPVPTMWQTRNKDFGPRLGFAWDVFGNGRTSLRGGYGISYDRIFDNIWSNGAWNPPFYGLLDSDATAGDSIFYSNPPKPSPSYDPVNNPIPHNGQHLSVRTMENNLHDSSAQNFYLGVERQLKENFLLRVNWQGSLGRHLPILMNYNRYDGLCLNATLGCNRPNAFYSGFNYRANGVNSNYNALVTEVQKRFSHGLQFQFGYTWSHLLDTNSDLFAGSTSQGSYSQPFYYISNANQRLDYGTGAFDHTHTLKLNYSYEIPFMRDQKGLVGKVAGGWQLTGFLQAYSGHPIEVYSSRARYAARSTASSSGPRVFDANGNGINIGGDYNLDFTANDRPVYVGTGNPYSNGSPADGIFKDNNLIGCGQAGLPANVANVATCNKANGVSTPNTLFVNPAGTGLRYGTMARNEFRGPWYNEFDAALFKNFKLNERFKLQVRAEGINLPNHPNFDYIQSNLNSGSFGKAQGQANTPRIVQLALRLTF